MAQLSSRRARRRSEEGAVLLLVMLILLVVTTISGISLQAAQFELRGAGFTRAALQTQYISEAAMSTTMTWVDASSPSGKIKEHLADWNGMAPPPLAVFAEPPISLDYRIDANRTLWSQQADLRPVTLPPITRPGQAGDVVGTLGPRVVYNPGIEDRATSVDNVDYAVDMYDCRRLTGMGSAGSVVNELGSGAARFFQLSCVMTARGRSFLWGGNQKTWRDAANVTVLVNRHTLAHDSRGTFVSPPIPL